MSATRSEPEDHIERIIATGAGSRDAAVDELTDPGF